MGRARFQLLAAALAAVLTASCGSTPPTSPPGGTGAPPSAGAGANALAAVPRPADGPSELASLLRLPATPLDPGQATLRDSIVQQLGPALGPIQLSGMTAEPVAFHPATTNIGGVGVGFLIIELGILGRALPSKEAADTLVGFTKLAVGVGRDAEDSDGPHHEKKTDPFTGAAEGMSATGSLDTVTDVSGDHSLLTLEIGRSLTLEYTKGSDSGHLVIDIDSEESVDICPDPTGAVPVKVHTVFTMISDTETETATIEGTFTGQTDSQANLASITGHATVEGDTKSGSDTTKDYGAAMDGIAVSGGKVTDGTFQGSGDGVVGAVGAAVVDIENSIPAIFDGAKRAWQDSGCVALEVPDLNGRAAFGDGGGASASKDVDVSSKTDFTVQVHDRFRHQDVDLPVKMVLSSKESIDPTSVSSLPQSVAYEAPPQPGQTNDVVLESKSLQGATKLTLHFRTKQPTLVLSAKGSLREQISVGGGATVTVSITVSKTTFDENGFENDVASETGKVKAVGRLRMTFAAGPLPCGAVTGTESGTIPLVATLVTADDGTSTWSIHADQSQASFSTSDTCIITAGNSFGAGGGFIPKALAALGTFSVPMEPGTYSVSGSRSIPVGTDAATMSVTVYPPPTR